MKKAKTKRFTFQGFDAKHYKTTEQYAAAVDALFARATKEIAVIATKGKYNPDKPFAFEDYPQTLSATQKIINNLANNITTVIQSGSRKQWLFACQKNDEFVASIMDTSKLNKKRLEAMQDRNLDALKTFQGRKVDGLDLSQRVWKYVGQFKNQIEQGLDVGLGDGRSAQELSRDLRKNLQDPDRLFRRVRNKRGNLVLSKAAKAFHPGQGVYRSSYKNAMRLTRSEVNMAYREADWMRWQQLDFVVGFEVRRSNREPQCKCKLCDKLVGRYPKTFKFKGWHPQCMCYATAILMDDETFNNQELSDLKAALHGTEYTKLQAKNAVTDMPQGFKDWVSENESKQANWGSVPYFIRDNFEGGILANGLKYIAPTQPIKPVKTEEQKADIQARWDERKRINAEYEMLGELIPNVRALVKDFSLKELHGVFEATKKTMGKFTSLSLEDRIEKLKFELEYSIKHSKYKTTPVANEIYKRQIAKVEYLIAKQNIETALSEALEFVKTTRSTKVKQMVVELTELLNKETPIATLQYKAQMLNAEVSRLETERLARMFKKTSVNISSTLEDFEEQDIPTLKNTRKLIKDYIRNKRGSSELYKLGNEEKMKKIMLELFDNSDFGMYIGGRQDDVKVLNQILDSYLKSQIETGTGGGYVDKDYRKKASQILFGTDNKKAKAKDYEKYGFLMDRDIIKQSKSSTANQYGNIAVRFKKDKVITTFTMQDSLDSGLIPSLTTDPKVSSFGYSDMLFKDLSGALKNTKSAVSFTKNYARSYIELQYHGHLGVDAIESVFVPKHLVKQLDMKLLNKYRGKIKFYTEENGKLKILL